MKKFFGIMVFGIIGLLNTTMAGSNGLIGDPLNQEKQHLIGPLSQEMGQKRDKLRLNRRAKYRVGVNAYAFGPVGKGGLSLDWFITPKWNLEVGAGARNFVPDLGFFGGIRYHFFGKTFTNLTPYIGAYTAFAHNGHDLQNYKLYFPFGIHRIKRNGFSWSIEVAYQADADDLNQTIYGGGRIGFRF